jgi:hypothetical protein
LEFEKAASLRDQILRLKDRIGEEFTEEDSNSKSNKKKRGGGLKKSSSRVPKPKST